MNKSLTLLFLLGTLLFPSFSFASVVNYQNIFNGINQQRTLAGLSQLEHDERLDNVASDRMRDMIAYWYWDHVNPITGKTFDSFFPSHIHASYAGEILAGYFPTSEEVITAWMNSPTHRQAMLNGSYNKIGIMLLPEGTIVEFSD